MGVVGIQVHGLKDLKGSTSPRGDNPFEKVIYKEGNLMGLGKVMLSDIVKCYSPSGRTSKERYEWIKLYLNNAVEEAIRIRKSN